MADEREGGTKLLRKSLMTLRRVDFVSVLLNWVLCSRRYSGWVLEGGIEIRRVSD